MIRFKRLLISFGKAQEGDIMRRKCFFLLIVLLLVLYTFDFLGISLAETLDESLFEESISFTGKVIDIRQKDSCIRLTVEPEMRAGERITPAENILVSYYGEEERPWELLNSRITFDVKPEHPVARRNPHCFD